MKKIHLALQGIKVIQTLTFRNVMNDLASIALFEFPLGGNDTEIILVKTSKSYDIACPMFNDLECNLDATTKLFCSQYFLDSF